MDGGPCCPSSPADKAKGAGQKRGVTARGGGREEEVVTEVHLHVQAVKAHDAEGDKKKGTGLNPSTSEDGREAG